MNLKNLQLNKVGLAVVFAAAMLFTSNAAYAACSVPQPNRNTDIDILSNSFPLVNYLAEEMESCSDGRLAVKSRLTSEHRELTRLALDSAGSASYHIIQLSNSDFDTYVRRGWLTPITEYVEQYRDEYNFDDIPQSMWDLASFEGEIYAIPIQSNLQHFFYRGDLLEKHGLAVPETYQDVLAAAETLQREEGMEFPIAQTFGRGWGLATEFTNIYMSLGGRFFDDELNPVFQEDGHGLEALRIMAAMLPYMSPNALSFSNDDTMVAFQQGESAMGNIWASRAANMDDEEVSRVVGLVDYASAPAARSGAPAAATSFWDGYAIPANVREGDRELAFQIIAEATDGESMAGGGTLGFLSRASVVSRPELVEQNRHWPGQLATVNNGAPAYPGQAYFGLAHGPLGNLVADALAGELSPQAALDRAAQEYNNEARAKGFLQ